MEPSELVEQFFKYLLKQSLFLPFFTIKFKPTKMPWGRYETLGTCCD